MINSSDQLLSSRFEKDVENVDAILLLAAEILCQFEVRLNAGNLNIDEFAAFIKEKFQLDDIRTTLFDKAIKKFKAAEAYTKQQNGDLSWFLKSTNLSLEKYDRITAETIDQLPGVILLRIHGKADALQLNTDIHAEETARFKSSFIKFDSVLVLEDEHGRSFVGKSLPLKSLGLPEDLHLLGVLVVCEDIEDEESKNGVIRHEYAHAIYSEILKKFIHRYFTGIDGYPTFQRWTKRFTEEIRGRLFSAIGDFSTKQLIKAREPETDASIKRRRDIIEGWGFSEKDVTTREDNLFSAIQGTLCEEQYLLNEMRAYGFSHSIIDPLMRITHLKIQEPRDDFTFNIMDSLMVQRYFDLHLAVVKTFLLSDELRLLTLSVLGVSQNLTQAQRLVQQITETRKSQNFASAEKFQYFVSFVSKLARGSLKHFVDYNVSGQQIITYQDAAKRLLPSREIFEQAVAQYCVEGADVDGDVAQVDALYFAVA